MVKSEAWRVRGFPLPASNPPRGYSKVQLLSIFAGCLLLAPCAFPAKPGAVRLASPGGRIQVSIQVPAPGTTVRPSWSTSFQGKPILTNCSLGLQTTDGGELLAGVRVVRERKRSVDQRIPLLFGKADHANDRFQEVRLT